MSITTYAELKTAIATWLARDDLTAYIPDFITLFETNARRRLRSRQQIKTTELLTDEGDALLPSDYVSPVRLTWLGDSRIGLGYVAPQELDILYPESTAGTPLVYTIEGTTIKTRPVDDDTELELVYLGDLTTLANGSNWLIEKHPDLYLFGSLVEAEIFNKDPERASIWKSRRDEIYAELDRVDFNERPRMAVSQIGAAP